MRFGLLLPAGRPADRLAELARAAEDEGFSYLWHAVENLYRDPLVGPTVAERGEPMIEMDREVGDGAIIAAYACGPGLRHAPDAVARAISRLVALWLWISDPPLGNPEPLPPVLMPGAAFDIPSRRGHAPIAEAALHVPDTLAVHLSVAGTLDDVHAQVRAIRDAGIDQLTIYPVPPSGRDVLDVVRQFAREVVPSL